MSAFGLRDMIRAVSPPWLAGGIAEKLLYSFALVFDVQLDKANQAMVANIATRTKTADSLPLIGADKLIPRGLVEAAADYATRLKRAYDDWYYAGSPRAIINQILGFVSPALPRILFVNNASAWDYVPVNTAIGALPTHLPSAAAVAPTANWNWDGALGSYTSAMFWRVWAIVDKTGWVTATRTWGDAVATWGDVRYSWGLDTPATTITSLRPIIGLWKSQHSWVRWIIVCVDSTEFIPTAAPGDGSLPDGNWGYWSKIVGNTRVASRSVKGRYCDGVI